jgi:hypothetical protein
MIHVGMGHENLPDFKQVTRRKRTQVPQVEQQGFPPVFQLDENPRIIERIVDQPGIKHENASLKQENTRQ